MLYRKHTAASHETKNNTASGLYVENNKLILCESISAAIQSHYKSNNHSGEVVTILCIQLETHTHTHKNPRKYCCCAKRKNTGIQPSQTWLCAGRTYLQDQFKTLHWLEYQCKEAVSAAGRTKGWTGQRLSNYLELILR